jgi:hypothetical protein
MSSLRHRLLERAGRSRALRNTIWAHDAIPASEWVFRNIKRVWLPIYDVIIIGSSIAGVVYGVPVIETIFPEGVATGGSIALGFSALVAGVGLAFPALPTLEAWAKSCLLGLIVGYAGALFLLAADGDPNRALIAGIALCSTIPAIIRLDILKNERQKREAREQLAAVMAMGDEA